MIVCLCHRVSDRDIARAAKDGCADYDTLQDELRVGTSCGACEDCARSVLESSTCAGTCGAHVMASTGARIAFA